MSVVTEPSVIQTRRVATVDVGTNSIRLLVAEARSDGSYRLLDDEKVVARLGRGMSRTRMLTEEAMLESAKVIARMKDIAEGYDVEVLRAVATCAVREARNRDEFIDLVRRDAGLDLEVISGDEEGRLAFLSVRRAFDIAERDVAIVDIGGGSTEIVLSASGVVEQIHSLSLGAVRLTETTRPEDLPPDLRLKRLRKLIKKELKGRVGRSDLAPPLVIGTGGTFTTLASVEMQRQSDSGNGDAIPPNIRGFAVSRLDMRRLIENLNAMSPSSRAEVAGLSPDRADIIVAGLAIAEAVMKQLGANELQVHDRGIRDGLLLSLTSQLFPDTAPSTTGAPDRMRSVRQFAEQCHYERDHSEHVTTLALEIFDQLSAVRERDETIVPPALSESLVADGARGLLETASVLHDIGYHINYSRHHKHSYHLIIHSDLAGFGHRELEIVANIARYHRRAHPKKDHPNFRRLPSADQ